MSTDYLNKLVRKLGSLASLTPDEELAIATLPVAIVNLKAQQDFIREGDRPSKSALLVEGFVISSRVSSTGDRQITSIYVPGDIPDLQSLHLEVMDFNLTALVPSKIAFIEHDALRRVCVANPRLCFAFWRTTLVETAIYRAWIVNVGQRQALSRAAHLICELLARLWAVGLAEDKIVDFPLTQAEFADAIGISSVHANRMLQELRSAGLIELKGKRLSVLDWDGLCTIADFDVTYLHLRDPEKIFSR